MLPIRWRLTLGYSFFLALALVGLESLNSTTVLPPRIPRSLLRLAPLTTLKKASLASKANSLAQAVLLA